MTKPLEFPLKRIVIDRKYHEIDQVARAARVKQLLAQGLNGKQISQRLSISPTLARELVRATQSNPSSPLEKIEWNRK